MELLGIFHKKTWMEARGVCEAPYIEKGGNALSARDAATSGGVMACALGRMRNAAALAEELGLMREERSLARIVLAAYGRWGEDYIEHVEGPVLTAVLDRDEDRLILCRDRVGERRVFYTIAGGGVALCRPPRTCFWRQAASGRWWTRTGCASCLASGRRARRGRRPGATCARWRRAAR